MPLLSFTLDDGNVSQIKEIYPIFKKHGFRATFYVVGNWLGRPGKLNLADLELLESDGNEIGSHSLNHRPLTKLGTVDLENEVIGSLQALDDFRVMSFAYPFGLYNDQALRAVSRHYSSARAYDTQVMLNTANNFQRYALNSISLEGKSECLFDVASNHSVLSRCSIVKSNDWLILTLHGRTSFNMHTVRAALNPSNMNFRQVLAYGHDLQARLSISRGRLRSFLGKLDLFCEAVERLDIPVVTVSEGLARLHPE
jgi:peptidoglycan/xylan/chitin deacetylase (PgdA/CDA1 family)